MAARELSLGELADQIYQHGLETEKLEKKVKEREKEEELMSLQLLNRMQEAGTDIVRGEVGTANISKYSRPRIDDFEKATPYLRRNIQLFERRIGSNAYKELMEQRRGKPIPGLSLFEEDRVHVRKRGAKN